MYFLRCKENGNYLSSLFSNTIDETFAQRFVGDNNCYSYATKNSAERVAKIISDELNVTIEIFTYAESKELL
jgi:hypothetical protein